MACHCIHDIDAKLAPYNTRIMLPIMTSGRQAPTVMIVTDQVETGRGKRKAVGMFATYCPFCGEPYISIPAISLQDHLAEKAAIAREPLIATALANLLPSVLAEIEQRKTGGNAEDWEHLEQLATAATRALEGAAA